jgi:hypothetical protein
MTVPRDEETTRRVDCLGRDYKTLRRRSASAKIAAVMMIAYLASSSGAFAYDRTGLAPVFDMTTCGQYAADRKLPRGVGMNGSDMLYVAGFLSAANL